MKQTSKLLGTFLMLTFVFNCSSVKVTDSWKDVKTSNIKNKNVLVVSKTDNDIARIQFESDIVQNLEINDITAIESFKLFPKLNMNLELEDVKLNEIKKQLKNQGIEIVLLTVLKDVQEYEQTVTNNSSYSIYTYPVIYRRGYRRGFVGYNTVYLDSGPMYSTTSTGKKYVLETVIYDLTLPEEHQLTSVITSVVDNPESIGTTSKDFSKKVVKEIVK